MAFHKSLTITFQDKNVHLIIHKTRVFELVIYMPRELEQALNMLWSFPTLTLWANISKQINIEEAEEKWFIGCANLPRVWATTNPKIVHILMANGQLRCHQGYMEVAKPHPILALRSSLWGQDLMAQSDPLT